MRQILFVKYNRTRAAQFQLKTEIVREDEVLTVEKTALTEAGEAHIRSFGEKYEKIRDLNPAIRFLKPEWKKDKKTVSLQYLNGKTVGDALGEAIVMGEVPYQELETVMKVLFPENADAKIFEATPEFETVPRPLIFLQTLRESPQRKRRGSLCPFRDHRGRTPDL